MSMSMMVKGRYHSVANAENEGQNATEIDTLMTSPKFNKYNCLAKVNITSKKLMYIISSACVLIGIIFFLLPIRDLQNTGDWCPNISWEDNFNGPSLNLFKWSYQNGDGCDVGLCGWGNNELEFYTEDNLQIANGTVIMEARHNLEGSSHSNTANFHEYTSSKILTRDKVSFGPIGRFEARIKLPRGQGIWPAFWMLPADNLYGGWPNSGEIDIMENIGKEGPNTVHGTIHYGLDWPKDQYNEEAIFLPPKQWGDFSSSFHVFAVEREVGLIRWFVDDIMYSVKSKSDVVPYLWPFDEKFYFILNLAVGGGWPGNPDNTTTFPQQMIVDYVRVYNGTFPRIEGKNQVNSLDTDVIYEIVDGHQNSFEKKRDTGDNFYNWVVPDGATIKSGQGTTRILVNFGESSGIVLVELHKHDEGGDHASFCNSQTKKKIGLRVKVVDNTLFDKYNFDCGCPSSCTQEVLNRDADGHSCGQRIQWLINEKGKSERAACIKVSYTEHNGRCGPCYPDCHGSD